MSHRDRRHGLKSKAFVLSLYGGKCVCCGEHRYDFLVLDHTLDTGVTERKENRGLRSIFRFLAAEFKRTGKIRKELQILCSNCSTSKAIRGGTCQHHPRKSLRVIRRIRSDVAFARVWAAVLAKKFDLAKR